MELITGENDKNRRLDRILRKALHDYPLPLIHKLLRQKKVLVDGKPGKPEDRVECGVLIKIRDLADREPQVRRRRRDTEKRKRLKKTTSNNQTTTVAPEILWENPDLIAVNKPVGISVHGKDSLDDMVRAYLADKLTPSLSFKPGPLHRLDKPSSGIVVFSKSLEGARLFTSLMREHKIRKTYLAVVEGEIKKEEIWQDDLFRDKEKKKTFVTKTNGSGKNAVTKISPLSFKDGYTLIKAEIETGRTHQIRAQAAAHGHPLAGDVKYGAKQVSGNREQGAGNKEQVIGSRKQVIGSRKQVIGSRKQVIGSRKQVIGSKEQVIGSRKQVTEKCVDIFLHAWKLEFLDVKIEAPVPDGFPEF